MSSTTKVRPASAHAYQDRTQRFALDIMLRRRGFRIHSRPAKGPPIWERNHLFFTQIDALKEIPQHLIVQGLEREDRYYEEVANAWRN